MDYISLMLPLESVSPYGRLLPETQQMHKNKMWVLDLFLFESSNEFPPSPILRALSMLDKIQIKFVKLVCFGYEYTFAHTITSKLLEVFYLPAGKINFYIICTSEECKTKLSTPKTLFLSQEFHL